MRWKIYHMWYYYWIGWAVDYQRIGGCHWLFHCTFYLFIWYWFQSLFNSFSSRCSFSWILYFLDVTLGVVNIFRTLKCYVLWHRIVAFSDSVETETLGFSLCWTILHKNFSYSHSNIEMLLKNRRLCQYHVFSHKPMFWCRFTNIMNC